jgi:hypothetical protein
MEGGKEGGGWRRADQRPAFPYKLELPRSLSLCWISTVPR